MALNTANRAGDLRRSKWETSRGQEQEGTIERLQREIDKRPQPRYEIDEMVLSPLGIRRITDKYYSATQGWQYTFFTRGALYRYSEKQLLCYGDALLMQDISNYRAGG